MNTDNKAISAQTSSKEDAALPFTGGDWYIGASKLQTLLLSPEFYTCNVYCNTEKIAMCYGDTKEEAEANARLIAESKNLYYALRNANFQLREIITDKFGEDVANMSGLLKANEAILNRIQG